MPSGTVSLIETMFPPAGPVAKQSVPVRGSVVVGCGSLESLGDRSYDLFNLHLLNVERPWAVPSVLAILFGFDCVSRTRVCF